MSRIYDVPTERELLEPGEHADLEKAPGGPGLGCGAQLQGPPPNDLYRALVQGSADEQSQAALELVKERSGHARTLVRRALGIIATRPSCPHLRHVTDTLEDPEMDDTTRASAALVLGAIARDHPCTFPGTACPPAHDPIPQWSQHALKRCASDPPVMVQRACVEALGYVAADNEGLLISLRDAHTADTLVRLFAGRALTRLTGVLSVSESSLEQLVDDARVTAAP